MYRATMSGAGGLEAEVALKVLRRDIDPRGQAARRLRDEGRMLSRLHHPSILRVHDLVVLEGRLALVTEFVDGEDLGVLLATDPPPPRALVEIVGMVAGALDAAWNAPTPDDRPLRLVHRDIKPSNIRVGVHGGVKLLDFGIARADSLEREARTQTDLLVGSPSFMAPERFLDPAVHPASDVFALGATLYEGLARRRFYGELEVPGIAGLAISPERYEAWLAERLRELAPHEPALLGLVRDQLAWDPERRPTAGEVADRCDRLLDALRGGSLATWARGHAWDEATRFAGELDGRTLTEGALAPVEAAAPGRAAAPVRRGRRAAVGAVLVAAALSAPFALSFVAPRPPPTPDPTPVPVSTRPLTDPRPPASWPLTSRPASRPSPVAPAPGPEPAGGVTVAEPPGDVGTSEGTAEPDPPRPRPKPAPSEPAGSPAEGADIPSPAPASGAADAPPQAPEAAPAVARGRVEVRGDAARVRLSGPGGAHDVPGEVPPGEYDVLAVFNGREVSAGHLVVRAGEVHRLSCAGRMFRCEAR